MGKVKNRQNRILRAIGACGLGLLLFHRGVVRGLNGRIVRGVGSLGSRDHVIHGAAGLVGRGHTSLRLRVLQGRLRERRKLANGRYSGGDI